MTTGRDCGCLESPEPRATPTSSAGDGNPSGMRRWAPLATFRGLVLGVVSVAPFLGIHEAAAVTGDARYRHIENQLAEFGSAQ